MKTVVAFISLALPLLASADDFAAARAALQAFAPGVEVEAVEPAPLPGYVQMVVGPQLIYVSKDGKYLIEGALVNMETRENLTETAMSGIRQKRVQEIGEGQRFVFPAKGETKHKLTVFTDIDCGYCRKLHQQMDEYNALGIEVQYLMYPRAGIGSHSHEKAVSAWCAKDRNAALTAAKAGEEPEPLSCDNPVEAHYELGRQIGLNGTPALVTESGRLIPGYLPPARLIKELEKDAG